MCYNSFFDDIILEQNEEQWKISKIENGQIWEVSYFQIKWEKSYRDSNLLLLNYVERQLKDILIVGIISHVLEFQSNFHTMKLQPICDAIGDKMFFKN